MNTKRIFSELEDNITTSTPPIKKRKIEEIANDEINNYESNNCQDIENEIVIVNRYNWYKIEREKGREHKQREKEKKREEREKLKKEKEIEREKRKKEREEKRKKHENDKKLKMETKKNENKLLKNKWWKTEFDGIGSGLISINAGINTYYSSTYRGCIDGEGLVLMDNGHRRKINQLKVGDKVCSFPNNVSKIKYIIISNINKKIKMVKLDSDNKHFWITYKHPILVRDFNDIYIHDIDSKQYPDLTSLNMDEINKFNLKWIWPTTMNKERLRFQSKVYNFLLDSHHTINVNGYWCCTLGDDYYKGNGIGHPFWSNSIAINKYIKYHETN